MWTALAGVTAVLALAGCTPRTDRAASAPITVTSTVTASMAPTPVDTAPVTTGPTATADGTCPFLTMPQALNDLGERLGRVTVTTSAGAPVGCTFYPATGALAESEHLPPATVPVIAITLSRYADTTAAHNAMVLASRGDPRAYSDAVPGVDEGISFATTFYAADADDDRAYVFRKGTTLVLVRIAQTASFNARHVGTDVAATIR